MISSKLSGYIFTPGEVAVARKAFAEILSSIGRDLQTLEKEQLARAVLSLIASGCPEAELSVRVLENPHVSEAIIASASVAFQS